MTKGSIWLALALLAAPACSDAGQQASTDQPPPGVQQVLARGAIPAILQPEFVPAAEAELPEDAWVLGVVVEGIAKAYSLNLLNQHEVVNDRSGGTAFAAVW